MNKDIYSILNDTRNEDSNFERLSDMEVNNIMAKFNENKKTNNTRRKTGKFFVGSAAIAACLAAFIIPTMSDSDNISHKNNNAVSMADNSTVVSDAVQKNSFFLSVSAAEIESGKAFVISNDFGGGEFPFSGRVFSINGTNIKNVSLSINKGELYKSSYESSFPKDKDVKPDKSYGECCKYIGNEYTEAFDENISYGFYLSEEIYDRYEAENPDGDLRKAWYACLDEFNGATLNISVEYEDRQTESIGYTLKSGMLELNKETMELNGNFSDGSTPYVYGIYFDPKIG